MIEPGKLDQRITIETPTTSPDELGAEVVSWAVASRPYARVIETPGREFLKGEVQSERKAVFVIRWRAVAVTDRVIWRGTIYDLSDVTGTQREGLAYLHGQAISGGA